MLKFMENENNQELLTEDTLEQPLDIDGYSVPGEIRSLSTAKLSSGLPYQRPVKESVVNKLIREWDDRLLEPIAVSVRDGRFHVVDGQHRLVALKKMNGGKDVVVACRIYTGLTYKQEAELCFKLDRAKKRLTLAQSTNALVESNTNPRINEIRKLVGKNGFTWALGGSTGKDYEIVATRALISAYDLLGAPAFSRMLALLNRTWKGNPCSLSGVFLSGMALFVKTYEAEFKDHIFVKRLSGIEPAAITQRSKTDYTTNKASLRVARLLMAKYNAGRGGRKLTYRFDK